MLAVSGALSKGFDEFTDAFVHWLGLAVSPSSNGFEEIAGCMVSD